MGEVQRVVTRDTEELMTSQQVAERVFVSVRTLWRMVRNGKFPQPVRYNRKVVRWKKKDVEHYMEKL